MDIVTEQDKRGWELVVAFIQGAQWWEWHKEKATMWQSDQGLALQEALRRLKGGTLGKDPEAELEEE